MSVMIKRTKYEKNQAKYADDIRGTKAPKIFFRQNTPWRKIPENVTTELAERIGEAVETEDDNLESYRSLGWNTEYRELFGNAGFYRDW